MEPLENKKTNSSVYTSAIIAIVSIGANLAILFPQILHVSSFKDFYETFIYSAFMSLVKGYGLLILVLSLISFIFAVINFRKKRLGLGLLCLLGGLPLVSLILGIVLLMSFGNW